MRHAETSQVQDRQCVTATELATIRGKCKIRPNLDTVRVLVSDVEEQQVLRENGSILVAEDGMSKKKRQVEDARQRLRDAGLRSTPGRLALLKLLSEANGPISHQEAIEKLSLVGIDKSTIFRALQDLSEAGLARRMELGDHVWRYERAGADDQQHDSGHPHLLCLDCGTITCLGEKDVKMSIAKSVGEVEDVLLKGHCSSCLDAK